MRYCTPRSRNDTPLAVCFQYFDRTLKVKIFFLFSRRTISRTNQLIRVLQAVDLSINSGLRPIEEREGIFPVTSLRAGKASGLDQGLYASASCSALLYVSTCTSLVAH